MCAAKYGHKNIIDLLVKFEADVDAQDKVLSVVMCQVIVLCSI